MVMGTDEGVAVTMAATPRTLCLHHNRTPLPPFPLSQAR